VVKGLAHYDIRKRWSIEKALEHEVFNGLEAEFFKDDKTKVV
jgi:hypothetical protein